MTKNEVFVSLLSVTFVHVKKELQKICNHIIFWVYQVNQGDEEISYYPSKHCPNFSILLFLLSIKMHTKAESREPFKEKQKTTEIKAITIYKKKHLSSGVLNFSNYPIIFLYSFSVMFFKTTGVQGGLIRTMVLSSRVISL